MSIFLKWGVPAFVTVIGGTAAAIATAGSAIPEDLATRAAAAIGDDGNGWAHVDFDMRDATVTGTATTQEMIDAAVAQVAAVHGVRSVTSNVVLAESASPFPFLARVEGGRISLSGALPDEAARTEVLAAAGEGVGDELRPMSGAPRRDLWLAAVGQAMAYAREFDEGEVALSDLTLTVSGRARSAEAYDRLQHLAAAAPADGVTLAFHEFEPALLSPYEWHAEFDGSRLILAGAVPSESLVAELQELAKGSADVSSSLVLASGAPKDFAETVTALVQNLLKLESGSAAISDNTSSLTGQPRDAATAEVVRVAMTPAGTTVTLGAPAVEQYWFTAERSGSEIVLDGFVPDEALRDRLAAAGGVNADGLELGRGAPDRFASGVDFVIEALRQMSEGRGTINGTSITLEGRAATAADFTRLETSLALGAPQGLILAQTSIKPPLAAPFTFQVEKAAGGAFSVTGHVPSSATRRAILAAIPGPAADSTTIADGNPADFAGEAIGAIGVLALLDNGKVSYDGASWSLSGAVDSASKARAAEEAFAATGLRSAGWSYAVQLPAAPEVAALPVIDPYTWRAQKAADGAVTFSGFVPTEQMKAYLAVHAGARVTDGTALGAGAPDSFVTDALAGLDAVLALDEGSVSFSAGNWSLDGKVASTTSRHAIEAALRSAADVSDWHVAIQAADAAPVVTPFTWSAAKGDTGAITFDGYVPTEALRGALAQAAGAGVTDKTLVGSGEPAGFEHDAQAGLAALLRLKSGELHYDGSHWSISGQPERAEDAEAVRVAIAGMSNGGNGWTQALADPLETAPEVSAEAAAATAEPETEAAEVAEPETADEPAASDQPEADTAAAEPVAEDPTESSETEVAALAPEPAMETAPAAERNFIFGGNKVLGGPVTFNGIVPADATRRFLAVITKGEPSSTLKIDGGLPEDFIANAEAGSRALALLADGRFGLDGTQWVFTGRAESEAQRTAALAELAAAPQAGKWQTDVSLLPPLLVCRDKVDAFAARNAILFQSGSARIAPESLPAIDELAADLALCPEASVEVEGHTDSDGDAAANLALSVARAEAVVDALIERGVSPDRLYAIGYGESLPIASNETRAGKQANRRIAFNLSDE